MSKYEEIIKKYEESVAAAATSGNNKFSLKNYYGISLKDGENLRASKIRILPIAGATEFDVKIKVHNAKVGTDTKKKTFPCLKDLDGTACPFCEARAELLKTGTEGDKILAKDYGSRLMYIIKVIDRDNEADGVKFWRFNHDYTNKGIYDKIIGIISTLKQDIDDPNTGRDLTINIGRDQNKYPTIQSIVHNDPTPLTTDKTKGREWLADARTWKDVFSVRPYDYLEIVVKGGIPYYDKINNKWVDKETFDTTDNSKDELNSELSMGADKTATSQPSNAAPAEDIDDLPF